MTKQEAINELKENKELGISYGQGNSLDIELITEVEFLNWFNERNNEKITIETNESDIEGEFHYQVITRSSISKAIWEKLTFDTLEKAEKMYVKKLSIKYESDNGTGGVWYNNEMAIEKIKKGKFDDCLDKD